MALHKELQAVVPSRNPHSQAIYDLKPNSGMLPRNNELRRDTFNRVVTEQTTSTLSRDDRIHVDNRTIVHKRMKSAVLFTMDSIYSYEQNSLTGGASGVVTYNDTS